MKKTKGILPQSSQRNTGLEIKAEQVKESWLNSKKHIQVKRASTDIR
jgi:hypothetical protein